MVNKTKTYKSGQKLLTALIGEGKYIFNSADAKNISKIIDIPKSYIPTLLSLLVNKGWIMRLRRGRYIVMGQLPGQIDLHPFAIATNLIPNTAISHWSALHHHNLTEQIPLKITAITTSKMNPPHQVKPNETNKFSNKNVWEFNNMYFEYTYVNIKKFFGIEKIWVDEKSCIPITDKERTVLETFASMRYFGGIGEALGILESNIHEIDITKLVDYAIKYDNAATIKRVGWTLEYFRIKEKVLSPLLNFPIKGYRILDSTKENIGRYNKKWMIRENVGSKIS